MSSYYLFQYANLIALFTGVISGMVRFRRFDTGARMYWLLVLVIFLTEVIAYIVAVRYKNNLGVYSISAIVQTVISCLYFDNRIRYFKERHLGRSLALLSVMAGMLNFYIFQPATTMNFNFLIWQAAVVFSMCVLSIREILKSVSRRQMLVERIHLWLTFILAAFWPITILQWLFYSRLVRFPILHSYVDTSLFIVNIIENLMIAILLFLYPAPRMSHGL